MTSIEAKVKEAAARRKELFGVLAETDHALPALEQQRLYITGLQNDAANAQKRVDELDRKRQKELKEHEKYRDSVMKRLAFKISGKQEKFKQRAAKEEQEYFEALQQEHQANEMKKSVDNMLAQALKVRADLEGQLARRQGAQAKLDSLYNCIFQGPSPGFPEEDKKERESNDALQQYHDTRVKAESEGQAIRILMEAQLALRYAASSMQEALRYSTRDMFGGGTFADMMERNALSQAELKVSSARMLVQQAQRFSPMVRNLPPVSIAQGSLISDVFFDNIFSDMAFHEKIKASTAEVERCAYALDLDLEDSRSRHRALSMDLQDKARKLEESRLALQKAREEAFETTLAGTVA